MTIESAPATARASDRVLARGVLYRALKLGFDRPDEETVRALFDDQGRAALRAAASALEDDPRGPLGAAVEDLFASPAPSLDRLRQTYERLFGHTLRGRVCPYECEYGHRPLLQQAQELADLSGFYAAFGLRTGETRHERPDHVACELEFLEFLARKECWALANDDAEMAEISRTAARKFLGDHLARFGRAFARSLQEAAPGELHGALGSLCEALLRVECERLGLPLGPEVLELRSTAPDDIPMACGSDDADGLVRLGGGAGGSGGPRTQAE